MLLLALKAAGPAQAYLGRADHPAIVIDEVVGLLITLAGVSLTWQHAAAGFLIFRTLDILKPPPIPWFTEGDAGGLEVVVDDVLAGVMGRLVLELVLIYLG